MAQRLNVEVDSMFLSMPAIDNDTLLYYDNVVKLMKTAVLCDFFDSKSDSKGRIKLRYRHENSKRLEKFLMPLVDAGMYKYNRRKNEEAMEIFKLYLDCTDGALFQKQNQNVGLVAYYVSLLSFGKEDYSNAEKYADVAIKDSNFARDAAEIKINCMNKHLVTKSDSTKYILSLLELHDVAPENSIYFKMLLDYLSGEGHQKEMELFAIDETKKHPENKVMWTLKGEAELKNDRWNDAIDSFKHSLTIDSTFVPAVYNIGLCYVTEAKSLREGLTINKQKLRTESPIKFKSLLNEAKEWIIKASLLDPQQNIVEWKHILEYINKMLG
jgi:hypothetical protein